MPQRGSLEERLDLPFAGDDVTDGLRRLALIAEKTGNGVVATDPDGGVIWANAAFTSMTGYMLEEVLGLKPGHFLSGPQTDRGLFDTIESAIAARKPFRGEVMNHRKDGSPYWCSLSIDPVFDGDVCKGFIAIEADITDRKRLATELAESERQSQLILENVRDVVFRMDANGRWTYLNPAWQELTGYTVEEGLQRSILDFVHPDDVSAVQEVVARMSPGRWGQADLRVRYLHKSGEIRWADVSCRSGDPNSLGAEAIGTLEDVTEAQESLRALKAERDFNEAILQAAGSLIVVLNVERQIVRFNQECERVTGFKASEIIGRPFYELLVPQDEIEGVVGELKQISSGKFPSQFENHWLTRTGEKRLIRWSNKAIVKEDGEVDHVIGVGIDVTEQRQTEQALRESQDRYASALAGSTDGIWDWDLIRGISYFSDRTLEMLGFQPGELPSTGDPFFALLHPDDRLTIEDMADKYFRREIPTFGAELRVRRKAGDWVWMLIRGAAVWDESGRPYRMAGSLTDVTQRREQLRMLEESERRFEEAQVLARMGSWQYDVESNRATWSPNLFRVLGLDPAEGPLSSDGLVEKIHPADIESFVIARQRTRDTGEPYDVTPRIRVPSGELYIRVIGHATKNAEGKVIRTFGSIQDVTEFKQAEFALKRNEEMLSESQRLAHLGSWEIDLHSRRVDWSAQTFLLFGRDPALGAPGYAEFVEMLDSGSRKSVRRALRETSREGKSADLEVQFSTPDGGTRYLRVLGRPSMEHGRVTRIHGSIQDVTEEKVAAQRLATQEAFLRNVIDTDPNFIFVKDSAGAFVLANRAVAAAYGTTPEGLIGKTDADFNPNADEIAAFAKVDQEVIATGAGSIVLEERVSSVAGPRWLHTVKCPIVSPVTGERQVLGISVDITERVQNQRELEAAREAALESSRMKSEFLANMSHEIRTPMNGVIGMSDILLDSRMDAEQRELTRTIRDSAESLLTILNDILDFSKIEAGKMSLESLPVDLADILERVASSFAPRAAEKGVRFDLQIDWREEWTFATDPVRLRQILTNLVGNAVKFTDSGEVCVALELHDGKPRFLVRDTGIGISRDRQETIFGAFTQADGSTTRKYGGTGLGLAIARQLSTLLGGEISLESQAGEGSCFSVLLDIPRIASSEEDRRLNGLRIAIHGDEADSLGAIEAALAGQGATLVPYGSPCDLTLVDGRYQRTLPAGPAVVLLKRGASAPPGNHEAVYEPLTRRSLVEAVVRAIDSRKARQPEEFRHGRVLLVDDNLVNQRVAQRQLERFGLMVDVAENGREALQRTAETGYALVLMDVQMPEMDGLEATRRIRERDDALGRHLPIIAMTAHAMEGDRERCLEAGMDDYLTKPLRREELRDKIASWVDTPEDPGIAELDEQYVQQAFGDDEGFFAEVLKAYITSSEGLLTQLRVALGEGDHEQIRALSHTLKGSSRSIGANAFADLCQAAESVRSIEEATGAVGRVLRDAPRLLSACRTRLRSFISSEPA